MCDRSLVYTGTAFYLIYSLPLKRWNIYVRKIHFPNSFLLFKLWSHKDWWKYLYAPQIYFRFQVACFKYIILHQKIHISIFTLKLGQNSLDYQMTFLVFFFKKKITKLKYVGRRAIFLMFSTWFNIPRQQLQAKYHFSKWKILVFMSWLALLHAKVNWRLLQLTGVMMNSCSSLHSPAPPHHFDQTAPKH